MALQPDQIQNVEDILRHSLRSKFQNYNPEPASMPFHVRLLGRERLAIYAFIHSLNTQFGRSVFEAIALALGSVRFASATSQQIAGTEISSDSQSVIQDIINDLIRGTASPCKPEEIEAIRAVCRSGEMKRVKPTRVDVKLVDHDGTIYLIDIKTAKPNIGEFKLLKRTLLEWAAVTLAQNPEANVVSMLAIPYNPYEPEPYARWTLEGVIDLEHELKVAAEFWDFLGGEGTYNDLLRCFERVGEELRPEIDAYFDQFSI